MSRNFEDEYRNMLTEEVPDLWNRIENKLQDKNSGMEIQKNTSSKSQQEKTKKIQHIYRKKFAIAACLSFIVLAGGAITWVNKDSNEKSAHMDATEMANNDGMSPLMEEMTDVQVESTEEEYKLDEVKENFQTNGSVDAELSTGKVEAECYTDVVEENGSGLRDAKEEQALTCQAIVKITSVENSGEEILWYGEVMPSVYSVLQPGQIITFCIGELDVVEPEIGKTYEVALETIPADSYEQTMYMLMELEHLE